MASNPNPIFEFVLTLGTPQTFASGDTTTKKTIATGSSSGNNAGTRIDTIMVSTDDTTAVNLAFYVNVSSTDYYIGNVQVPIGSGYTNVVRVDAITTLAPVLKYLVLPPGVALKCNCVATMTAAKTTTVVAMGGDY